MLKSVKTTNQISWSCLVAEVCHSNTTLTHLITDEILLSKPQFYVLSVIISRQMDPPTPACLQQGPGQSSVLLTERSTQAKLSYMELMFFNTICSIFSCKLNKAAWGLISHHFKHVKEPYSKAPHMTSKGYSTVKQGVWIILYGEVIQHTQDASCLLEPYQSILWCLMTFVEIEG